MLHDISNPVYDEINAHVVEPQVMPVASARASDAVELRDFKVSSSTSTVSLKSVRNNMDSCFPSVDSIA